MAEGLFREEALRHHAGARSSGDVLRVPPSWTRWTFAFLVAVFVAGAAYAALGSVAVYAQGLAAVETPESVTLYFSDRDRRGIASGLVVQLGDPSDARRTLRAEVRAVRLEPAPLTLVIDRIRGATWPGGAAPSRVLIADAILLGDRGAGATAGEVLTARAPVGKESLLGLLFPSLRSARGD